MLIGLNQVLLVDRNRWNENSYLSFNLPEIFDLCDANTLEAMIVLLHFQSICPEEGENALDEFNDKSYRHALEVSDGLKYSLRECVELLGNEVLHYYRINSENSAPSKPIEAKDLTLECLRFMYRILFILFIEADPKLRYAPMKEQAYQSAYSFESLRDIADNVKIETEDFTQSYYIFETLEKLFNLIYNGYPTTEEDIRILNENEKSIHGVFEIEALKAHIFDPERTPLITSAKLRDSVMIQIVKLMSISRPSNKKYSRPGRISYSTLGVNQLGAVYESLLSFSGFIAKETLYEVKNTEHEYSELDVGYFVSASELKNYDENERVYDTDNRGRKQLKKYEKGYFIYRIAGREKEKSASYYTPESLTQCLVKYALKELIEGKTADEILDIKVCEPAMGSAAFLNEVINQLSECYLNKKRQELGEKDSIEFSYDDLQKVKMFIADRNVYGIDLNPVAVELAEVSLWLNTIHSKAIVPWFGTQLATGNSLVGARRECYQISHLKDDLWFKHVPKRIMPNESRKEKREVYHFLLGDPGMCAYKNDAIKELEPQNLKLINEWRKEFTQPFTDDDITTTLNLSKAIDELWKTQAVLRKTLEKETRDPLSFYGHEDDNSSPRLSIRKKDEIYQQIYKTEEEKNAGSYARLKFAMDYWCSLWFWPVDKAELLPTRSDYLFEISYILTGSQEAIEIDNATILPTGDVHRVLLPSEKEIKAVDIHEKVKEFGKVNIPQLCSKFDRLALVRELSEKHHFLHWELEFADIFAEKGGFDLILGNPPFVKLEFNEKAVLSDLHPDFILKDLTAPEIRKQRSETLKDSASKNLYFDEYILLAGMQNFLNAYQNYPLLIGQQADLYKCFLPQSWKFSRIGGFSALIHPGSVYNDSKGEELRKALYKRLKFLFGFYNEKKLFRDVHPAKSFFINIYKNISNSNINFSNINNLFHPVTIDECFDKNVTGEIPKIKDKNGKWNLSGHPKRVIDVDSNVLKLYAKYFDSSDNWQVARLPLLYTNELIPILEVLANQSQTLESLEDSLFRSVMFDQTNAQKKGIIKKSVHIPNSLLDTIYSGPNIGFSNPLYKASRKIHEEKSDYDNVDLLEIPENFRPRVVYSPASDTQTYLNKIPTMQNGEKYTSGYRILMRNMFNYSNERSLFPAIVPEGVGHIHTIFGIYPQQYLPILSALLSSIVYDFLIRITGKADVYWDILKHLPFLSNKLFFKHL
ncbi:MAG: N-6 DNA methylase, partial [Deltaproteobacteria bacterium]|nr:N-6 DNA methylase [Deltaproteobacteria bacterium]